MKVCISSGHGKYISGAVGPSPWGLHEHNEAVRVVNQMADACRALGVDVETYEDTISKSQNENLDRICDWHNAQGAHDLDLSIHFNAASVTSGERGSEVFYTSSAGQTWARELVNAICIASGLKNRGAKNDDEIGGLYFLSHTQAVACLVEVCFTDAEIDCQKYTDGFMDICSNMALVLAGNESAPGPTPPPSGYLFTAEGTCSTFGGPLDYGVSPSEGLAMWYEPEECPWLMLPDQPSGTTGMARRLDTSVFYLACRWPYDVVSKERLRGPEMALVTAHRTGISRLAHVADWGPHEEQTGRAADLSPALMSSLDIDTDDSVTVAYPWSG
jgi:N-acetylmuramoyl-L-alanine amidase